MTVIYRWHAVDRANETTVYSLPLLHLQVDPCPGHLGAAAQCSKTPPTPFFKSNLHMHFN